MSFNDPAGLMAGDASPGLRALTWYGLCARIVAAQDLRRAFEDMAQVSGAGSSIGTGSFDGRTARFIATRNPGVLAQSAIGEVPVNPNSSVNGKGTLGTPTAMTNEAGPGRAEVRD